MYHVLKLINFLSANPKYSANIIMKLITGNLINVIFILKIISKYLPVG